MAEIGSTLRETRIRKKIDITTVETATKIRAKYLRAIENEEWAVIPGPTYVKTFIRTYAQYLGLDAHMLVDEYATRFEEPEELELPAFSREPRIRTRVRRVGPPSRLTALGVAALAIIAFLLVLGLTAGDDGGKSGSANRSHRTGKGAQRAKGHKPAVAPAPAPPAGGHVKNPRVNARILPAGGRAGPFTSRSFKVTVGNGGGDLQINGKLRKTPERSRPLAYLVQASGTKILSATQRPTCG
jgi:hypothetical protein